MKDFFNKLKPRHVWDIVIVAVTVCGMFVITSKLDKIDNRMSSYEYSKLEVTDIDQLESIANHLTRDEWNATGYAMYIMQPKNYKKTYKELVASSKTHVLPNRISLADEIELELELYNNKYFRLDASNTKNTSYILFDGEVCIIIPIQHNHTVVAELYVFFKDFEDSNVFLRNLNNKLAEAQVLAQLVK